MTDLRQAAQQALEALAIADNIALVGAAYTPNSIDLGLRKIRDSATALRTALEQQQAEPVQKPPYPGWKPGCQVCGVHGVTGYVCPRSDCPTKVTCGGVV